MTSLYTAQDNEESTSAYTSLSDSLASDVKLQTGANLEGSAFSTESETDLESSPSLEHPEKHSRLPASPDSHSAQNRSNANTIDDPVYLHSLCRVRVTRLNVPLATKPHIRNVCKCGGRIIAILTDEPPLGVAIPGGISISVPADNLTITALAETPQSTFPVLVPLRYRSKLSIPLSAHQRDEVSILIQSTGIIIVGGAVLRSGQVVGSIVSENDNDIKYVQLLRGETDDHTFSHSDLPPAVAFTSCMERRTKTALNVDIIAYVERNATFEDILLAITEALHRFVDAAAAVIDCFHTSSIIARHFAVMGGDVVLTVIMPDLSEDDTRMVDFRKQIHDTFLLPHDRPLFRAACRVLTTSTNRLTVFDGGHAGRLADVHIGIKSHGLGVGTSDVEERLVEGSYLYCHYLQDRFNDSGWGCAYRSLQTLISWCVTQRYTTLRKGKLPTHQDIQRALVNVGDKPEGIIGSREWIGANEVCYALEKLTNVCSKIVHVSRGSEMLSKARLLARHFEEQGSPVVVGGGVLAWTIIGVARDERTGLVKYLILDPHYEGRDDLKTIQSKGWVAWKSVDIFKDDSFYNLCLPQRPNAV